jgi:beta-lactamase superfamily II metal-dependent hydrolase
MAKAARRTRPPAASASDVTVRMYCQGLGDCFLLSFPPAAGGKRVFVMIDCGVILGTPNAQAKMKQVTDDIAATVKAANGSTAIDLLVATHEHWDHVSGFVQVPDKFDPSKAGALTFKNVWLAWTEKPGHPLAESIRADHKAKKAKLWAALTHARANLSADNPAATAAVGAALGVLDFFGPMPGANKQTLAAAGMPAKAAADSATTEAAMAKLTGMATKFCTPGEVLPVPGAAGVKAFVLGPPEDLKLLKRDAPRKGKDEAYEHKLTMMGAMDTIPFGGPDDPVGPFDDRFALTTEEAKADPFFRQTYGFADDPLGDGGTAWQRIEGDWLFAAASFALKMDSDTNNTSLALAFELPDGRTLVFPGDAQMGNWESWAGVKFGDRTGLDLLRKAVLYKVGHHGSHNATRKEGGLEEMTSGELVAMIPVDEQMAAKKRPPKTGWKMPFGPLYERLKELTANRILRADFSETETDADGAASGSARWPAFRRRVTFSKTKLALDPDEPARDQPLYVQYTLPG